MNNDKQEFIEKLEKKFRHTDYNEIYKAIMKIETYRNKLFIFNILAEKKKTSLNEVLDKLKLREEKSVYASWYNLVSLKIFDFN